MSRQKQECLKVLVHVHYKGYLNNNNNIIKNNTYLSQNDKKRVKFIMLLNK